ncbi:WbuC family cupin fold metalloprotein [Facilibium subflavum]|uniref:WbuC family cupin fold metalloprotein n=1 Tax=Facilibium subflavum TaxID=2219058 RepID=UPI001AAE0184|nr:WbuC family cupin fold metalloprotein [Facilibium subflavum]
MIKKLDNALLQDLQQQAAKSNRKRSHYNLHEQLSDPVNRLCISLSKGTYIRPHRHQQKWELILALKGEICVLIFNDDGGVVDTFILSPEGEVCAFEMPANTWHTLYPVTEVAAFFEVKPGPFEPTPEKDFAQWAPKEGEHNVDAFLQWMQTAQKGDSFFYG